MESYSEAGGDVDPAPPAVTTDVGQFAVVPMWVVDLVSNRALHLYAVLGAVWADRDGMCWPSRQTIADRMGVSRAVVDRAKQELIAVGALTVESRYDDEGQASNLYRLHLVPNGGVPPTQNRAAPTQIRATPPPLQTRLTPYSESRHEPSTRGNLGSVLTDGNASSDTRTPSEPSERSVQDRARQVAKDVWERSTPKPAVPFVGVVKIARRLLDAGHPDGDVVDAMLAVPTISVRWVEGELNKRKRRPATVVVSDWDRSAPSGEEYA